MDYGGVPDQYIILVCVYRNTDLDTYCVYDSLPGPGHDQFLTKLHQSQRETVLKPPIAH